MLRRGLIEEVAAVLSEGHRPEAPGLDSVGIREAVDYLHGRRTRESMLEAIVVGTRQYAKRQETWFRNQLPADTLVLDATRPAEEVAGEIAEAWSRRDPGSGTRDPKQQPRTPDPGPRTP
jgi:tRNA dimethylallyltransferase